MNITDEDWKSNNHQITKTEPLDLKTLLTIEKLFKDNGFIPKEFCQQVLDEAKKNLTKGNKNAK